MIKFLRNNAYQTFLLVLALAFLIDALIGEQYSHENLYAYATALLFLIVGWLDRILTAVEKRNDVGAVYIYMNGNMDVDEVARAVKLAIKESNGRS